MFIIHSASGGVRQHAVVLQCPLVTATSCTDIWQQQPLAKNLLINTADRLLGPGSTNTTLVLPMSETPTDTVMPLHIVKLENSLYYRHVQYTLALMCAKNRKIIFCSFLDLRENVQCASKKCPPEIF